MFDFIQSIILSDFLIFMVFTAMLLAVTSWAFREQELPGYFFGWLIGIFFIVIYSSLTGAPSEPEAVQETVEATEANLSAFAVLAPAFMGLVIGFGLLFLARLWSGGGTRERLLIAIMTTALVTFLFFLTTSDEYARRVLGIFALAFSIGALSTFVFKVTPSRRRNTSASAQVAGARDTQDIPEAKINDQYSENRIESIRRFFNGER